MPAKEKIENPVWGVTFTPRFAKELGIDWQKSFILMLDDLNFRHFRLAVYWDEVESKKGTFDFGELDWLINEIEKRNGSVILTIGRKNLRWPECYQPAWIKEMADDQIEQRLYEMIRETINHFKDRKSIYLWQVENEPFFSFGECPAPKSRVIEAEVALVRSLDNRPIMLTDSGELSTWLKTIKYPDILGITMYRDVSNPWTGDFHWPSPAGWYSKRAKLAERRVDKVIVAELQMEPWYNQPFTSVEPDEQAAKFNIDKMKDNIDFAKKAGFSEYYLWGAEWWFYMEKNGHNEYLEHIKSLNKKQ